MGKETHLPNCLWISLNISNGKKKLGFNWKLLFVKGQSFPTNSLPIRGLKFCSFSYDLQIKDTKEKPADLMLDLFKSSQA